MTACNSCFAQCNPLGDPVDVSDAKLGIEWSQMVDLELGEATTEVARTLAAITDGAVMYREVRVVEPDGMMRDAFAIEHASTRCSAPLGPSGEGVHLGPSNLQCEPIMKEVLRTQKERRLPDVMTEEDGNAYWWEVTLKPVSHDRLICVWRDITTEVHEHESISESLDELTEITKNAADVILRFDVDGTVQFASDAVTTLTDTDLIGHSWFSIVHEEDLDGVRHTLDRCAATRRVDIAEFRLADSPNDTPRWLEANVKMVRSTDEPPSFQASIRDITTRRNRVDELVWAAHFDELTGLHNRAGFVDRMRQLDEDGIVEYAVVFIDLDDFKLVNDTFGHAIGDLVLQRAANRIQSRLRSTDFAARIGGDEFLVMLKDANGASRVADRLRREICRPYKLGGKYVNVGASLGISVSTIEQPLPSGALIQKADERMYADKRVRKAQL